MLLHSLIHPPLLEALAAAGHGSKVLIADGNYPVATGVNHHAKVIHLNLQPGLLDAVTVLHALQTAIPIEAATVMTPGGEDPTIFAEFAHSLPGITIDRLRRDAFYAAARGEDTAVVIATGETKHFGNLLVTIGVAPTDATS
ncbi:MAG: RbsD or FucU transport [Microbacteriaceae bacterium]|jgi:L-fucose mutarotase|nr:RbsD or FucU transport [Microbacteriaceae bacterium]